MTEPLVEQSKHVPLSVYVCDECGRVGRMHDFNQGAECRPGWTHGRLIEIDPDQGFLALVVIAQMILEAHYPPEVFKGESFDSGAQFVHKLREALRCVHAEP